MLAITAYGCDEQEAALWRQIAPRFGVRPTITDAAISDASIDLALGARCISVGHKSRVTNATLLALSQAGVKYISTRSIGCDHIDVDYAQRVGIQVGNVAYSPDSVADFTLMLRDLTAGVVGTGRIGTAVIDRLRGFGGRITPHTAFHTDHALADMVEHSIVNCLKFESEQSAWTG